MIYVQMFELYCWDLFLMGVGFFFIFNIYVYTVEIFISGLKWRKLRVALRVWSLLEILLLRRVRSFLRKARQNDHHVEEDDRKKLILFWGNLGTCWDCFSKLLKFRRTCLDNLFWKCIFSRMTFFKKKNTYIYIYPPI